MGLGAGSGIQWVSAFVSGVGGRIVGDWGMEMGTRGGRAAGCGRFEGVVDCIYRGGGGLCECFGYMCYGCDWIERDIVCLSLFLRETGIGINLWTGRWIVIISPAIRSDPVVSFTVDNAMLVNLQHLIATAGYRGTTVAMVISSERVKMELEALGTNILLLNGDYQAHHPGR
jgi:hypothetical protein